MITKEEYEKAKQIVQECEKQLNISDVSLQSEQLPSCECENVETYNGWGNEKCFRCIDCGRVW